MRTVLLINLCLLLIVRTAFLSAQSQEVNLSYFDYHLPFNERVDILLEQMSLEEKVSQLTNDSKEIPRLKIPQYNWWNECLHGVARAGYATVFPQSITVAASFNSALLKKIGTVISDEGRAKHHEFVRNGKRGIYTGLDFWSPNINIFRDPRWGRGHETYGEDPFLTGELATQFINGLQGDDEKYFKSIATSKHFAVHSGPEKLRHSFDVDVSERDLYETYLPAFKKTIKDARVYSVMGAYNRFRGESCSGHDFLLNKLLRDTWGFNGYVVSDCGAIRDIHTGHKIAESKAEAAAIGIKGGCDLNCGSYYKNLNQAVKEGLVSEAVIDTALKRVLLARFKLGMFDPEEVVSFSKIPYNIVCSDANKTLARKAAQESIILMKNTGNLLPLAKNKINKIAVIGPNADNWESLVGNYHGTAKNPVTFLNGIKHKVEPVVEILYSEGAHLSDDKLNLKPIPSVYLQTADGRQGLQASYYNNTKFKGAPVLERIDDNINFSWQHNPISKDLIDNFSVRWKGFLVPAESGKYELAVFSKRGMRVVIEDNEITNGKGTIHHGQYATDIIELEAGKRYSILAEYFSDESNAEAQLLWAMPQRDILSEAVAITKEADIAVVVLGLSQRLEGEDGDKDNIALPTQQMALLKAIKATKKPVVLVLNAGSALAINWAKEHIDAIINVGYPGEQGGNALADVLFGDYNPAGRLPMTYYTSLDELPPFEDYDMEGRTYRYYKGAPLYPFGYGLSYTTFSYGKPLLNSNVINVGASTILTIPVTNTGTRDGEEVIQVYLKKKGDKKGPLKTLRSFKRIAIAAGQTAQVKFELSTQDLTWWHSKSEQMVMHKGDYVLMVGGSSSDKDLTTIDLRIK